MAYKIQQNITPQGFSYFITGKLGVFIVKI